MKHVCREFIEKGLKIAPKARMAQVAVGKRLPLNLILAWVYRKK